MYSEIHVGMIFEGSLVLSLPYTGARNCCGQLCCPVYSSYTCDYLSVLYTCTLAKLFICIFPDQFVLLSWIHLFSKHEKKIYSITWTSFLYKKNVLLSVHTCCLSIILTLCRAADKGLSLTLMERLVKEFGDRITSTLTTQYRMHTAIMTWPSHVLYQDTLIAHDTVAHHLLRWSVVLSYVTCIWMVDV